VSVARQIVTLCDPCLADEVRAEGRTVEVVLDGKARSVELCVTHEAELLKPLADVLAEFGVKAGTGTSHVLRAPRRTGSTTTAPPGEATRTGKTPTGPRDLECLACGATYASATGLAGHLASEHGQPKAATLSVAYGDRCPLCGLTAAPKGLGRHTGGIHGLPIAQAFIEAGTAGDEFGVVAERLALLDAAS